MDTPSKQEIAAHMERLVHLRREVLHRFPELSGQEKETSGRIASFLRECDPDELITEIGGHGIAAIYNGAQEGPTVVIRCELDALAIEEHTDIPYRSQNEGVAHKCGHDGHMAILCGLAILLAEQRPQKGRAVLLFQPSEENGEGAEKVIADEKFSRLNPDWVFALHNIPGYPLHQVVVKDGRFNPAVNSIVVRFMGCTSHAGEPENGRNPALAMAEFVQEMCSLTDTDEDTNSFTVATPVYQHMGEKAYGISAGEGEVHFTIRCDNSGKMKELEKRIERFVERIGKKYELEMEGEWVEEFYSSHNDADAMDFVRAAVNELGGDLKEKEVPFKWGEDFGMFTHHYRGAMFCLGAGRDHPALHHPDYDFPDELIQTGVRVFYATLNQILDV